MSDSKSPTCTPEDVLAAAKHMLAVGLVEGTAGNIASSDVCVASGLYGS